MVLRVSEQRWQVVRRSHFRQFTRKKNYESTPVYTVGFFEVEKVGASGNWLTVMDELRQAISRDEAVRREAIEDTADEVPF